MEVRIHIEVTHPGGDIEITERDFLTNEADAEIVTKALTVKTNMALQRTVSAVQARTPRRAT
jgi:hypothetical protein